MSTSVSLIGRSGELETLVGSIARAEAGRGGVILIEGEAGIGKSRLVGAALDAASERALRTVVGSARELETERPFGAIVDALGPSAEPEDPDLQRIGELLSGEDTAGEVRFRAADLLSDLFERWSQECAVVLAIEDLHWADTSTLLVLDRLGRQASSLPLLVVGTARPSPRSRELTLTLESISPEVLRLKPLPPEASIDLASEVLRARPGGSLTRKLEAAAGNPLFETELLAALTEEGAIEIREGVAEVGDAELPPSLRLTILRRLGFLPEETLEVLRLASVFGSAFRVAHVSRLADRSASELLRALEPALKSDLVREQDDLLVFRHDLVRDAVYEDMPVTVRAELHRDAGRVLLAMGAPAMETASHVALGASPGDVEAVDVLVDAARDAGSRAPASSAAFLSRALELVPDGGPRRAAILAELAAALSWTGRLEEGEARATEALGEPGLEEDAVVKAGQGLIWALGRQGRDRDAIAAITRLLQDHPISAVEGARFVLTRAQARIVIADLDGAEADLEEGRRLLKGIQDDAARSTLLSATAWLLRAKGRPAEALDRLDEAMIPAARSGAKDEVLDVRNQRASALLELDRLEEAFREARELSVFVDRLGLSGLAPAVHSGLALHAFLAGKWDEADVEIETAEALRREFGGDRYAIHIPWLPAALAFHRNDAKAASREISRGEQVLIGQRSDESFAGWHHIRGLLAEADGRPKDALVIFEGVFRRRSGLLVGVPSWTPDAVRVALAAGDRDAAARFAVLTGSAASAIGTASARSAALRCRGLVQNDPGLLMDAVEIGRASPRPLARALTLEDAAVHISKKRESVALLEEALELLDGLGAERHARRVQAALRQRGVKRGSSRSARATFGWEALTESERRVVDLVGEGLRNRQIAERLFISVRTVESHVSSALMKVGASSRVELAATALAAQPGEKASSEPNGSD